MPVPEQVLPVLPVLLPSVPSAQPVSASIAAAAQAMARSAVFLTLFFISFILSKSGVSADLEKSAGTLYFNAPLVMPSCRRF